MVLQTKQVNVSQCQTLTFEQLSNLQRAIKSSSIQVHLPEGSLTEEQHARNFVTLKVVKGDPDRYCAKDHRCGCKRKAHAHNAQTKCNGRFSHPIDDPCPNKNEAYCVKCTSSTCESPPPSKNKYGKQEALSKQGTRRRTAPERFKPPEEQGAFDRTDSIRTVLPGTCEVRDSELSGKGVFTLTHRQRGEYITFFPRNMTIGENPTDSGFCIQLTGENGEVIFADVPIDARTKAEQGYEAHFCNDAYDAHEQNAHIVVVQSTCANPIIVVEAARAIQVGEEILVEYGNRYGIPPRYLAIYVRQSDGKESYKQAAKLWTLESLLKDDGEKMENGPRTTPYQVGQSFQWVFTNDEGKPFAIVTTKEDIRVISLATLWDPSWQPVHPLTAEGEAALYDHFATRRGRKKSTAKYPRYDNLTEHIGTSIKILMAGVGGTFEAVEGIIRTTPPTPPIFQAAPRAPWLQDLRKAKIGEAWVVTAKRDIDCTTAPASSDLRGPTAVQIHSCFTRKGEFQTKLIKPERLYQRFFQNGEQTAERMYEWRACQPWLVYDNTALAYSKVYKFAKNKPFTCWPANMKELTESSRCIRTSESCLLMHHRGQIEQPIVEAWATAVWNKIDEITRTAMLTRDVTHQQSVKKRERSFWKT